MCARRAGPVAAALCVVLVAPGCATPGSAGDIASPTAAGFDPVGRYDLTMSSATMVSEGSMEIRGEPGGYTGLINITGVAARVTSLEAGEDHMTVHATARQTNLILRLVWDGEFLSGNWILGAQRGTFLGRKRPGQHSGGTVSTGRSGRPPHSDQDPS